MSDDITCVSNEARRVFVEILDTERREELAQVGYGLRFGELSGDQQRMISRMMTLEDQA